MLRPIAKKTKCKVKILKKCGLPFVLYRYKNRKTFVIGAVLFIGLVLFLTSFVWDIEIRGNKKIETQVIMDSLSSIGIRQGAFKYRINTDNAVNRMMLDINELGWVGITLKGTKIKVEVKERTQPPASVRSGEPCDIVAASDGVVKSIIAKEGMEMVKPGDTVTKGQVLISGTIPSKNVETPEKGRFVHSIGEINARTWYEKRYPVEYEVTEKERTGRKKDCYSIVLLTKRINIFPGRIDFENYDSVEISKKLALGENLIFPFEFIIGRNYEYIMKTIELDVEEAKQAASDKAYNEVMQEIPEKAEIVDVRKEFIEDEELGTTASVVVECLENIGVQKQIGGN